MNKVNENYESADDYLEARPNDNKASDVEVEKVLVSDLMAELTQQTRKAFKLLAVGREKFKKSVYYKTLTGTTQPAHVASILMVLVISYSLWPESQNKPEGHGESSAAKFFYLGSFATHLGTQIWMSFVSGLALYFSLPRHVFGRCQKILFPKYFLLNTVLSGTTLVTFSKIHTNFSDTRWIAQMMVLSICMIIETTVYFYSIPPMLQLMQAKYEIEEKFHNGQEIGYQQTVEGLNSPEYQEVHKKFRKSHKTVAIGNVIAIGCSFAHLYYLASKITFV